MQWSNFFLGVFYVCKDSIEQIKTIGEMSTIGMHWNIGIDSFCKCMVLVITYFVMSEKFVDVRMQ